MKIKFNQRNPNERELCDANRCNSSSLSSSPFIPCNSWKKATKSLNNSSGFTAVFCFNLFLPFPLLFNAPNAVSVIAQRSEAGRI